MRERQFLLLLLLLLQGAQRSAAESDMPLLKVNGVSRSAVRCLSIDQLAHKKKERHIQAGSRVVLTISLRAFHLSLSLCVCVCIIY